MNESKRMMSKSTNIRTMCVVPEEVDEVVELSQIPQVLVFGDDRFEEFNFVTTPVADKRKQSLKRTSMTTTHRMVMMR
jgi:hypothetical protein